jgi:TDG/mug DNA glycosylase family protein
MKSSVKIVHPLAPVYDPASQVLILGSFPSVKSRELGFYYANRFNRFWPVLSRVFEEEAGEGKESRTAFCHSHHIALWDVIHSCKIQGSSDSSITDVMVNDLSGILGHTKIHTIFTTGSRASALYEKYMHTGLKHIPLPSTSSANARMHLEDLCQAYRCIRKEIHE